MALDRDVKSAVRKVVQLLHEFARNRPQPWRFAEHADFSNGDYYIDVVVNVDWLRIYVTFAAEAFRSRDGYERFEEVQQYLREKLQSDPGLLNAISLVVKDPEQYRSEGDVPVGLSDERIDASFVQSYFGARVGS